MADRDMLHWPNTIPEDCPFQRSDLIEELSLVANHVQYTNADTWYPSWGADDVMYSPWTDGEVNGLKNYSFVDPRHPPSLETAGAGVGFARIHGDRADALTVDEIGVIPSDPGPYGGRYPCGSLVRDGIWYYGTYCLDDFEGACGNWCTLGPFVGFHYSLDGGNTWVQCPLSPERPLFGLNSGKVQLGAPHFVDFGRDMQDSPDGKAYLVGHGTIHSDGFANWIAGDQVYLARVTPSIEAINDAASYEFFGGHDSGGDPIWVRDPLEIQPLLDWRGHMGSVTATYIPGLGRYLMCISRPSDGFNSVGPFDTYMLEARSITGPWAIVHYLSRFGEQAYFVNIPSRFVEKDGSAMWLSYSANFRWGASNPDGSSYSWCLREVRLGMVS